MNSGKNPNTGAGAERPLCSTDLLDFSGRVISVGDLCKLGAALQREMDQTLGWLRFLVMLIVHTVAVASAILSWPYKGAMSAKRWMDDRRALQLGQKHEGKAS